MTVFDLARLGRTPDIRSLSVDDVRLATTVRLWVVMNKLGRCPLKAMDERLGGARPAAHLHMLLDEVGAAWPDPFCVNPPCCPRLSHDEAVIVDMVALARTGDRPGFDRLLGDLLPADTRERLFHSAAVFSAALRE